MNGDWDEQTDWGYFFFKIFIVGFVLALLFTVILYECPNSTNDTSVKSEVINSNTKLINKRK